MEKKEIMTINPDAPVKYQNASAIFEVSEKAICRNIDSIIYSTYNSTIKVLLGIRGELWLL